MSGLPVLALAVGSPPTEPLRVMLLALARWCRPLAGSPDGAVALLATSPEAVTEPPRVPFAVWVGGTAGLAGGVASAATVILGEDPEVLSGAAGRGLFVPHGRLDPLARPVSPFVRARLRAARRLPDHPVLERRPDGWWWPGRREPLPAAAVPTGLGCAAAAVVCGPELAAALAWAAPCVTDPRSAAAVGGLDGVHLLVATTPAARLAAADRLASDPAMAARVGWAGRQLAERSHGAEHAAAVLLARLGVPSGAGDAGVWQRLAELGTPPDARIAGRAASATAALARAGSPEPGRNPLPEPRSTP